uniref:Uncharacterized protein n=1 Tax=Vaucheria litorea TaxID=109269 RepID=H6WBA5_VAULI|nr:hypothetical protein [Vaucheria litorea]
MEIYDIRVKCFRRPTQKAYNKTVPISSPPIVAENNPSESELINDLNPPVNEGKSMKMRTVAETEKLDGKLEESEKKESFEEKKVEEAKSVPKKVESPPPSKGFGKLFLKKSDRPVTLSQALSNASEKPLFEFKENLAGYLCYFSAESSNTVNQKFLRSGEIDDAVAINTLISLSDSSKENSNSVAEAIACIANPMINELVDAAVAANQKSPPACEEALMGLVRFMKVSGSVFEAVCPGIVLDPPLRYNGGSKKKQLEEIYASLSASISSENSEELMSFQKEIRDLLGIKEFKAKAIEQKAMMDALQNMVKDGGGDGSSQEQMAALLQNIGANGGPEPEMPSGPEMEAQLESFKNLVKGGQVTEEEVKELRKMYKEMGMDIDKLVKESEGNEGMMDAQGRELFDLLRQMLSQYPLK